MWYNSCETVHNSLGGSSSGPLAFVGFKDKSCRSTPAVIIFRSGMSGNSYCPLSGTFIFLSWVDTDKNYLISASKQAKFNFVHPIYTKTATYHPLLTGVCKLSIGMASLLFEVSSRDALDLFYSHFQANPFFSFCGKGKNHFLQEMISFIFSFRLKKLI